GDGLLESDEDGQTSVVLLQGQSTGQGLGLVGEGDVGGGQVPGGEARCGWTAIPAGADLADGQVVGLVPGPQPSAPQLARDRDGEWPGADDDDVGAVRVLGPG